MPFLLGISALARGLLAALGVREVRRAYWIFSGALLALALLLDLLGLWGVRALSLGFDTNGAWSTLGHWLVLVVGSLVVLLVAPLLAAFLATLAFPWFAEIPFFAALEAHAPARARRLREQPGLSTRRALLINLRRLLGWLLGTLLCALLGLLPVLGPPLALVLSLWLGARTLAWELLDPYLTRSGLGLAEQRAFLRQHRAALLGFALPGLGLLAIPLLGPLCFGLLQAAVAHLLVDVLEPEPQAP